MRLLLILTFFLLTSSVWAASFAGKLVRVMDGDTVEVMHDGKAERIRLAGIDCPEKAQPYGNEARRFTLETAANKIVTINVETTDRYGRTVGEIILPNGSSLNRELVKAGYAWWYKQYSSDKALGAVEEEARNSKRGLWVDDNPIAPWDWRRDKLSPDKLLNQHGEVKTSQSCGQKRTCKQMISCDEAKFYLVKCGLSTLDGDGDGVPCEALCNQ